MEIFRELTDRSKRDSSLRMGLWGEAPNLFFPFYWLLVFTTTRLVRLSLFKSKTELWRNGNEAS